jgi:hypothetical protein
LRERGQRIELAPSSSPDRRPPLGRANQDCSPAPSSHGPGFGRWGSGRVLDPVISLSAEVELDTDWTPTWAISVDGTNPADDWAAKALTRTTQADAADCTDGRQELEGLPPARATLPVRNSRKRARFESRGGQSGGRPGANRGVADRSSSHRTKGATHDVSQAHYLAGEHPGVRGDGAGPHLDLPKVGIPCLG